MKHKISVIVPVYNVAPYLARCLDSLINQTLKDIEIICIDDKSTDNSLEILHKYEQTDKRIRVIALDKNSGVATARNAGIDAATGEYLGFVDSDDYVDADFYEKLYATAKKSDADMARGNVKITQYDGSILKDHNEITDVQKNGRWHFCWQWWTAIYRSTMIQKHNIRFPVDVISGQDTVFLTKCISHTNMLTTCTTIFYNYIRREGSLDEQIMPPHKIASRIKAFSMLADIYNSCTTISDKDYVSRYEVIMGGLEMHFRKNTSKQCRTDISKTAVDLFKICKLKSAVAKKLSVRWGRGFTNCLQSYDAEGVMEFWTQLAQGSIKQSLSANKTFYLFGFLPIIKIQNSGKQSRIKVCGLQLIRKKQEHGVYRLYFMYIPIIRIKSK